MHLDGVILCEAQGQLCCYVDMKQAFLYYKGRIYEWSLFENRLLSRIFGHMKRKLKSLGFSGRLF